MHALVTGAGGFLGLYIVEQLVARGDRVRAFCRRDCPELRRLDVEIFGGDLAQSEQVDAACEGIDTVFHAAARSGIWGDSKVYLADNVIATANVVEACRKRSVERLIYTSSPSVTFDGDDQCGVDESAPYAKKWLCQYPRTKASAEQFVLKHNGSKGLLTCALRPHLIWGPRDRHLVPRLLGRARAGELRRVGDGKNLIDITYVENAAAAHLQAADALAPGSPVAGRAYFISQGEPVNCWQWVDELLALVGLPPVKRSISLKTAWRVGAVLETFHRAFRAHTEPQMTRFLAAQLGRSHYFDITRAKQDFGYNPTVSTAEGMRRLGEYLRANSPQL